MEFMTVYWDDDDQCQKERPCTPDEVAEIMERKNAPRPVPKTVTRYQAKQALFQRGLLDQVAPKIAAIQDATMRQLAQMAWEDASEFVRDSQFVAIVGAALGLSSAELDDLFRLAATF